MATIFDRFAKPARPINALIAFRLTVLTSWCSLSTVSEFSERIKMTREKAGLSKRALCKLAELSPSHVHWIETNGRAVHTDTAEKLARALKVRTEWLVTGKGKKWLT